MFYKIFPIAGEVRVIPRNIASRIASRNEISLLLFCLPSLI